MSFSETVCYEGKTLWILAATADKIHVSEACRNALHNFTEKDICVLRRAVPYNQIH